MRKVASFEDVQVVLNDILNKEYYRQNHNRNTNGFQIKNTGDATDPTDVVVLRQLHDYYDKKGGGGTVTAVASNSWSAKAILPGIQTVTADVLVNRYRVNVSSTVSGVSLLYATITAKTKPSTQAFVGDFLLSVDSGVTWNSIFPAQKLVLPIAAEVAVYSPAFAIPKIVSGNQFRVDVLQCDAVASGIEMSLFGQLV